MKIIHRRLNSLHVFHCVFILLTSIWVRAGGSLLLQPEIQRGLMQLNKEGSAYLPIGSPELGDEMRRLAGESQSASQLLSLCFGVGVSRSENIPTSAAELAKLWKWGGFAGAAFRASHDNFDEMISRYPSVLLASRLIGAMTEETGEPVLLSASLYGSRFDENHRFVPIGKIGIIRIIDVRTGESKGEIETEAQDFEIQKMAGGDVLVLKQRWRGDQATSKQQVRIQRARITKSGVFEKVADKTELLPWTSGADETEPVQSSPRPSTTSNESAPASNSPQTNPTPIADVRSASSEKASETKLTTPQEAPPLMLWSVVAVLIAAAIGLLCLMLKRRVK